MRKTILVAGLVAGLAMPVQAAVRVTDYVFTASAFTSDIGASPPQAIVSGSYSLSFDDVANSVTLTGLDVTIGGTAYTAANSGFQQQNPVAPGPDSGVGGLQPGPTFFGGKVYQLDQAQDDFLIRAVYGADYASVTPTAFRYTIAADGLNTTYTAGAFTIAAAPEPGAWAMLIAGFGVAGGALRRMRRRTIATA